MSSQLATWQHVTTQFKCDVTNRTCLNTIDANMCGAFKTKHTQPFNTQPTYQEIKIKKEQIQQAEAIKTNTYKKMLKKEKLVSKTNKYFHLFLWQELNNKVILKIKCLHGDQ